MNGNYLCTIAYLFSIDRIYTHFVFVSFPSSIFRIVLLPGPLLIRRALLASPFQLWLIPAEAEFQAALLSRLRGNTESDSRKFTIYWQTEGYVWMRPFAFPMYLEFFICLSEFIFALHFDLVLRSTSLVSFLGNWPKFFRELCRSTR